MRASAAGPESKSDADWAEARRLAGELGMQWTRPAGDDRSARAIIDETPLLRDLGDQEDVRTNLKAQVGDFETDADAAYRAAEILDHVETFDEQGNKVAGKDVGNGRIDGFTEDDEARHGTEAGRLKDFGEGGFATLRGKVQDTASVSEDPDARSQAEAKGIAWALPADDARTAREIIDASPLLRNLGDQSGVGEMLKDRVGDFEHDADAAYRAAQVLDQIAMYDGAGKLQTGETAFNGSIDGFTNSGEARAGTEAGRLQDFGKYGFERLPGVRQVKDIDSYKAFLKANPNADETSRTMAGYAAILGENFDAIKGRLGLKGTLTAADLRRYKDENPQASAELRAALAFWSRPGAFKVLDTGADPLKLAPDGALAAKDVDAWIGTQAPRDAGTAVAFLSDVAADDAVAGVDTSKLGNDVFAHPERYTPEQKAAVLRELLAAKKLVADGAAAGLWGDAYGATSIANRSGSNPDPQKVLADLDDRIGTLMRDGAGAEFLGDVSASRMTAMLEASPALRDTLQATYDRDIESGAMLDSLWDARTKDGKASQQDVLVEFFQTASMIRTALGTDAATGTADIQGAVGKSKHAGELKDFYEKSLATGDRYRELLETNDPGTATGIYAAEVALYNGALDPDFTARFDEALESNFTSIAKDVAFQDVSFETLKTAYGIGGGDRLDEARIRSIIETLIRENPEHFINADGTVATADQVLAGFRTVWDNLRQGVKLSDLRGYLSPDSSIRDLSGKGVLHGVSGLLLGGATIGRGAINAGKLTDRQISDIVAGSVQTASLIYEGGVKGYSSYLESVRDKLEGQLAGTIDSLLSDASPENQALQGESRLNGKLLATAEKYNTAIKGTVAVGGLANAAAGAYAIFDGVRSIRRGDVPSGALSIALGSTGVLSGVASTVEGVAGLVSTNVARIIPMLAGGLGWLAAGVGVLASLIPGLIKEGQRQTRADEFGDLLGLTLRKYEIDGVPDGDLSSLPESAWPEG